MRHFVLKINARMQMLRDFLRDDNGQDMAEYALVMALLALGATAAMPVVATKNSAAFTSVGTKFSSYTT